MKRLFVVLLLLTGVVSNVWGQKAIKQLQQNTENRLPTKQTIEKLSGILYEYFWKVENSTKYGVYRDPSLMKR